MAKCFYCDEPAVKRCMGYGDSASEWRHFCYLHATEADLLDLPLDSLRSLAEETGYPVNALAFVLEALHCAERLDNAEDASFAVVTSARERFRESSWNVLNGWKIQGRRDIGRIAAGLDRMGLSPRGASFSQQGFDSPFTLADMLRIQL